MVAPAWTPSTAYKAYQAVSNGGQVWLANADFTSGLTFNAANWTSVVTVAANAGTPLDPVRITSVWKFGPDNTTAQTVWTEGGPAGAVIAWLFDRTTGEGIHLTTGPNFAGSGGAGPNCLAIGNNYGGVGLFINNYLTGVGLKITNRNTTTNAGAFGLLISQNSNVAPGMYMSAESSTCVMPLQIVCAPIGTIGSGGAATGQILTEWRRSQAATADTLLFRVSVDSALFSVPVNMTGGALNVTGFGATADFVQAQSSGAYVDIYDTGGTTNQRRFRMKQSSGSFLLITKNDAGTSLKTILQIDQNGVQTLIAGANFALDTVTGTKIGTATNQKLAFYNATPVVQQGSTPAAATDLATALTLVNDLRSKFLTYGLAA